MTFYGRRLRWYWFLVPVLLLANLFFHWPFNKTTREVLPPAPPGFNGAGPGQDFQEKIQAALEKLPSDERAVVEQKIQADRRFFDSLQGLPPEDRRKKTEAYFAKNPPLRIPEFEFPPPPGENGGPDSPEGKGPGDRGGPHDGGPENGHIPPPDIRRGLDQGIVDSLRKGATP